METVSQPVSIRNGALASDAVEEEQPVPLDEDKALAALNDAKKKRADAAAKEFEALCKKHDVTLHTVQQIVNGQPGQVQFVFQANEKKAK